MSDRKELVASLKNMSMEELEQKLKSFKIEYFNLRAKRTHDGRDKVVLQRLSDVQKDIARCLTQIRVIQIADLKKEYEGKQYTPACLKVHTTKARRQALTQKQQNLRVKKVAKRNAAYKQIKFALK